MNNVSSYYDQIKTTLTNTPVTWLITGVAGFIGSNLLEALLKLNQRVTGLDNFSTGHQRHLDEVQALVTPEQWSSFQLIKGDIRNLDDCRLSMTFTCHEKRNPAETADQKKCATAIPVDYVLHHAALGSVPHSIEDPILANQSNIDGFLNMLVAARDTGVKRFVYAASSATYGDHVELPQMEDKIGKPLSPYAVTKLVNELYADVFARVYDFKTIGLRYFNIFGQRQDPNGAYAAVIPKWIASMIHNETVYINGDGETSRDFCFIENVVQANLLAATTKTAEAVNQIYNIAVGERTSLNDLFCHLRDNLAPHYNHLKNARPDHRDFRTGDVQHSVANINKAATLLHYQPTHHVNDGLSKAMEWYVQNLKSA